MGEDSYGQTTISGMLSNYKAAVVLRRLLWKELLSHGGGLWIEECKEEVLRWPPFHDSISPSYIWPYIVAFHHQDHVSMIGISVEGCARMVYKAISIKFAKILIDTQHSEAGFSVCELLRYVLIENEP